MLFVRNFLFNISNCKICFTHNLSTNKKLKEMDSLNGGRKTRSNKSKIKNEISDDSSSTKSKYFAHIDENTNPDSKNENKIITTEHNKIKIKTKIKSEAIESSTEYTEPERFIKNENVEVKNQFSNQAHKSKNPNKNSDQSQISLTDKFSPNQSKTPLNWVIQLENIRRMRSELDAPVDTMGCDQLFDPLSSPKDQRFQKLLALMLSSQTKDQVTSEAVKRLLEIGCGSCEGILNTSEDTLLQTIKPVSFYKTKTLHIRRTADLLLQGYHGDIPKSVVELCKLPGIGPKMAHLAMQTGWGEVTGIAVDTHVHRISNRLGWVDSKAPERTMKELEEWLPKAYWSEVNHLMVGFGQQVCSAVKPKCDDCLNKNVCLYYGKEAKVGKEGMNQKAEKGLKKERKKERKKEIND